MRKRYDLEERLIDFGVRVIKVSEKKQSSPAGKHLIGQLIRSGTSPGLHYGEAQSAESRRDFIHKMKLVLKELRETRANLIMIRKAALCKEDEEIAALTLESDELIAIFVKSIKTAKRE